MQVKLLQLGHINNEKMELSLTLYKLRHLCSQFCNIETIQDLKVGPSLLILTNNAFDLFDAE